MSVSMVGAMSAYAKLDSMPAAEAAPSPMTKTAGQFAAIFDNADSAVAGFASGAVGAQSVVEALASAEMALQTAVTVRDRVVGAYQELLRMPL